MKRKTISNRLALLGSEALLVMVLGACQKKDNDTLVIYSPHKQILIYLVVDMYQNDTGKKVEVITASTGELIARVRTETAHPNGDVFWGSSMNTPIPESRLFEEYRSPNKRNVEEALKNVEGTVTRFSAIPSTIIVNTTELTKACGAGAQITRYQSIIDLARTCPALKGRISNANPSKSSSSFEQLINQVWAFAYIEAKKDLGRAATMKDITPAYLDAAWDHMAQLIAVYDGKHSADYGAAVADVIQGETIIGLSYEIASAEAADNSDDVILVYPEEGSVIKSDGAAIIKGAKHLENAKEFIDYLLSDKVQNAIKTVYRRAVIKNADFSGSLLAPLNTFRIIKDNTSLNDKAALLTKYAEIFNN